MATEPRFRRRKDDRPREIAEAAFGAFADKGFAATRVEDVAHRAGISKGLMYRYFRTKEDLFKAVIRQVVVPMIENIAAEGGRSEMSAEAFLRGPLAQKLKALPGSRVAVVVRLMVAEGSRYPALTEFYWENVVRRGMQAVTAVVERGVASGEFRRTAVSDFPQLFLAPAMFGVLWRLLFDRHPLDTDEMIDTNLELVIAYMKSDGAHR